MKLTSFSELKTRTTATRRKIGHPRRDAKILWSRLCGKSGQLPNAIIIGAQKAGTTTLFDMLSQNCDVSAANFKEVHYFDVNYRKSQSWYRLNFPSRLAPTVLEASPYYMAHPCVPERVRYMNPKCRIIAILRDPVLRAHSQYRHEVRKGYETLATFSEAVNAEQKRLGTSTEDLASGRIEFDFSHQHYSYLYRGLYYKHLSHWLKYFPRSQLFVTSLEKLISNPQSVMEDLSSFLDLPHCDYSLTRSNSGGSYPPLDVDTAAFLSSYFSDDSRKLKELFGVSFDYS